jgi:hypothetical protein
LTRSTFAVRWLRQLPGGKGVPRVWWVPFSFNGAQMRRQRRGRIQCARPVSFAGSDTLPHYEARVAAQRALGARVCRRERFLPPGPYYRYVASHQLGLTCAGRRHLETAKHIEIPASGSVLLTSGAPGLKKLLAPGTYIVYTPGTVEALVNAALADPAALAERGERGRRAVYERHTHGIRIEETVTRLRDAGLLA